MDTIHTAITVGILGLHGIRGQIHFTRLTLIIHSDLILGTLGILGGMAGLEALVGLITMAMAAVGVVILM